MIEIVKEPTPIEHGDVAEPRNIRQIGQLQGNTIVYIEDYVYRFLHSEGREKKKYAFVFLGQIKKYISKVQSNCRTSVLAMGCRFFQRTSGIRFTAGCGSIFRNGVFWDGRCKAWGKATAIWQKSRKSVADIFRVITEMYSFMTRMVNGKISTWTVLA